MKARPHRADWDLERMNDLFTTHTFHLRQKKDGALGFGELIDRALDSRQLVSRGEKLGRIGDLSDSQVRRQIDEHSAEASHRSPPTLNERCS